VIRYRKVLRQKTRPCGYRYTHGVLRENEVFVLVKKTELQVAMSNRLASGFFDENVTALQRDILIRAIARLRMDDKKLSSIELSLSDIFRKNSHEIQTTEYERLSAAVKKMPTKKYYHDANVVGWVCIIHECVWLTQESVVKLTFAEDAREDLLALRREFTQFPAESYLNLRSVHAKDLYELLMRWLSSNGRHTFLLSELHEKLRCGKKSRKRYCDFNEMILRPAVAEINKKTTLKVSYSAKKRRDPKAGENSRPRTYAIVFSREF
jgi:plasmid replication initiation protein